MPDTGVFGGAGRAHWWRWRAIRPRSPACRRTGKSRYWRCPAPPIPLLKSDACAPVMLSATTLADSRLSPLRPAAWKDSDNRKKSGEQAGRHRRQGLASASHAGVSPKREPMVSTGKCSSQADDGEAAATAQQHPRPIGFEAFAAARRSAPAEADADRQGPTGFSVGRAAASAGQFGQQQSRFRRPASFQSAQGLSVGWQEMMTDGDTRGETHRHGMGNVRISDPSRDKADSRSGQDAPTSALSAAVPAAPKTSLPVAETSTIKAPAGATDLESGCRPNADTRKPPTMAVVKPRPLRRYGPRRWRTPWTAAKGDDWRRSSAAQSWVMGERRRSCSLPGRS